MADHDPRPDDLEAGGVAGLDRAELFARGYAPVPAVVGPAVAAAMSDAVWSSLSMRGVDRHVPATWPQGFVGKNQALRQSRKFDAFDNEVTAAIIELLLGDRDRHTASGWGPALVTFPEPGPWTVPHKMWHFDIPARGAPDEVSVVRLFGFVSDVGPQGGGTLVVEGTHELVRRMVAASPTSDAGGSAQLRKKLIARHPWFRALCREGGDDRVRQFMVDGDEIDGIRIKVTELTANAGDVVVMLPWTMHNIAMNCAATPRFMVTHSIYATAAPYGPPHG